MTKPIILAVDDDRAFLDSLEFALRSHANVLRASSLIECARVLEERKVDLIITDYRMSLGDGHGVVVMAKKLDLSPPVVLVTAYADKEMAIRSANLHVFALLEKPVDFFELVATVNRALAHVRPSGQGTVSPVTPVTVAGDLTFHASDFTVRIGDHSYQLTETEFRILFILVSAEGTRVSREELVRNIWGPAQVSSNLFDTHLLNLRKKVPVLKSRLRAIRGRGYVYTTRELPDGEV